MFAPFHFAFLPLIVLVSCVKGDIQPPESISDQYNLSFTASLPFPASPLPPSRAVDFIQTIWPLDKGHIQGTPDQTSFVTFVSDPFPNSGGASLNRSLTFGPVLRVAYPALSFSHNTGGAQFYSIFPSANTTLQLRTVLLSYEVAFDTSFDWVKGGKLPGLRGGPNTGGCSGGEQPTGLDCFSLRIMWRPKGQGEVYAYVPTSNSFCSAPGVLCNFDFGTSLGRGQFIFQSGMWNRISLLVRLNEPPSAANGNIDIYFNGAHVISQSNVQIRSSNRVTIGGLYFSTFFGGDDSTWATPTEQHTYFRDFRMWGSESSTNTPSSSPPTLSPALTALAGFIGCTLFSILL